MKIGKLNDSLDNEKAKEELLKLLNEYRGILTSSILDYLNSLIELEFSVIKEYISEVDRKVLSELEIYRKVAIYNIYNRTKNLFDRQDDEFEFYLSDNGCECLSLTINIGSKWINLFEFNYKQIISNGWDTIKIPRGFKTLNIGDISLFQTIENKELREAELYRVMKILERLYDEKNPYLSHSGVVGGSDSTWEFNHTQKIKKYEEQFKELDNRKKLNDDEKKEIEITKKVHDLLLQDFGLNYESFVDQSSQPFANLIEGKTKLKKTFIKKMPNLTITDYITYI